MRCRLMVGRLCQLPSIHYSMEDFVGVSDRKPRCRCTCLRFRGVFLLVLLFNRDSSLFLADVKVVVLPPLRHLLLETDLSRLL